MGVRKFRKLRGYGNSFLVIYGVSGRLSAHSSSENTTCDPSPRITTRLIPPVGGTRPQAFTIRVFGPTIGGAGFHPSTVLGGPCHPQNPPTVTGELLPPNPLPFNNTKKHKEQTREAATSLYPS